MYYLMALTAFSVFAFASIAFGTEPFPVPGVDPLQELLDLVKNWRAITPLALAMTAVTVSTSILKNLAPEFKYKRLAVVVLSVIYGGLGAFMAGSSVLDSLIFALISGGGAVAIYEAWKGTSQAIASVAVKSSGAGK